MEGSSQQHQFITYLEQFRPIPAHDQAIIASAFTFKHIQEGDYLLQPGNVCRERFFINKGVLRITVQTEKGSEVTHFFLKENQFCTILKSFNEQIPATEGIQAACEAEVLSISYAKLLALYDQLPYLKELIDQITAQALLDKVTLRNSYLGLDSTGRYNLFLKQQADIALRVSLGDVASYLGITQQSLSRIRKNLR
jgi:CRP-like cAMP-binding protein